MQRLIYQVYVGDSDPLFDECIGSVMLYCAKHGIEHYLQEEPVLSVRPNPETNGRSRRAVERLGYLPIFEKENALGLLGNPYDQVAVIDADVWIKADAPNIFDELHADFAGVVERDAPITLNYGNKLAAYSRGQYRDPAYPFMNMGVMLMDATLRRFCPETPREFLARPEFQAFIDGRGSYKWSTDQTLLNTWLRDCGASVQKLHWKWNALYGALEGNAIDAAHFVHFFLREHLTSTDPEELLRTQGRPRV